MADLRTEYPFVLPKGWIDPRGDHHREGRMRLATARDELEALADPTVAGPDDPRLALVVLARVITRLGDRTRLSAADLLTFFAVDVAYLQDVYTALNYGTPQDIERVGLGAADLASLEAVAVADVSAPEPREPLRAVAGLAPKPSAPPVAAVPAPPAAAPPVATPPTAPVAVAAPPIPAPVDLPSRPVEAVPAPDDDRADDAPDEVAEPPARPRGRRAMIEEIGRASGPSTGRR